MFRSLILLCVVLGGCAIGKKIDSVPAAVTPAGAQGWLSLGGDRRFAGEVLSVTETGIIMLTAEQRVTEIPIERIQRMEFKPFVTHDVPPRQQLTRLRAASRFPFGIPDPALAALLARSGQPSIEYVP